MITFPFRHPGTAFACLALAASLLAPSTNAGVTEDTASRWDKFARHGGSRQPAMQFPYESCFRRSADQHDLPLALLLAVARGESDFEPNARSKANAYGLMQILWPSTARHLGIDTLSQLLDPCTNIDAGARYLNEMRRRYAGDLHLALAAYNYGPGRIHANRPVPSGAEWYSRYIYRHLRYVLGEGRGQRPRQSYAAEGRLAVIRFSRPYRAEAFVQAVSQRDSELRLDWFKDADGGFRVVLLYASSNELAAGRRTLEMNGIISH